MPLQSVPETRTQYALVALDRDGREREESGARLTTQLRDKIDSERITDVFIQSHGWKGDVPAARDQYNRWFKAFIDLESDAGRMRDRFGAFNPLLVGIHWPSLPWGDEDVGGESFSFGAVAPPVGAELLEQYVERLGDSPRIRRALETILNEARVHAAALELTPEAEQAYRELNEDLAMGADGEGGAPGDDREPFDPQEAFANGNEAASFGFGSSVLGGILGPLRQLSFWKMKDRARRIGEAGMHAFLRTIQEGGNGQRPVRIHLMGHSFGCIVVSAMVNGPARGPGLARPIDSLVLVQGALSIWSYSPRLPDEPGRPGYFHDVIAKNRVSGAIVTTQSQYDTAVGQYYPLAAGARQQVAFAQTELPKYGALGAFGIRGLDYLTDDRQMMPSHVDYSFKSGAVYNLESSRYIRFGSGPSGAHNDIDGHEVAHALWQAAHAAPQQ
jgi:hypothetical protein